MKFRYVLLIFLFFAVVSCVSAETFVPNEGIFAFREVETFEINGINFTVPSDYNITGHNNTGIDFRNSHDNLSISVSKHTNVKKVKRDRSKNITAGKTMLGSAEGYLVDNNGTYTFSYTLDDKLVIITSKDMSLMIGIIEKN